MEDFDTVKKNLEDRGYAVRVFSTGAEAAAYLDGVIDGRSEERRVGKECRL